jgi:CCR4-NOT transcription complex subunit 1
MLSSSTFKYGAYCVCILGAPNNFAQNDKLKWSSVVQSFDRPDRFIVDTATLKLLVVILLNSPRDAQPHAVDGFWQVWRNPLYQLRLLDAMLSLPADTFNFVQLPGRRIVTVDDVAVASPTIKSLAANVQGHTWNSLELFQVLVRLGDSESQEIRLCVRDMLDKAIKISAELVHMGLLQVEVSTVSLHTLIFTYPAAGLILGRHQG